LTLQWVYAANPWTAWGESAFHHAVALAAGMAAQVLGARAAIPSIMVLLVTGVALGPDALGALDPAIVGTGRADLAHRANRCAPGADACVHGRASPVEAPRPLG
jgi:hypothetical protein